MQTDFESVENIAENLRHLMVTRAFLAENTDYANAAHLEKLISLNEEINDLFNRQYYYLIRIMGEQIKRTT